MSKNFMNLVDLEASEDQPFLHNFSNSEDQDIFNRICKEEQSENNSILIKSEMEPEPAY